MARLIVFVVALLLAAATPVLAQARLCPPLPADRRDPELGWAREEDFTEQRFLEATEFFDKELLEEIRTTPTTAELTAPARFWIYYGNSMMAIKGWGLKLAALLERGAPGTRQPAPARARFCAFLEKARWHD
jgi:hypothetical protein